MSLPPGVKAVVVDSDAGSQYTVVDTDQADGARTAVEHLLELGHRTVWHVGGSSSYASERRITAWRETLERAGRDAPRLLRGDWSAESGYRASLELAKERGCTAVFTANDQMALGVLRAFRESGISVPRDISIVGFDDIADAAAFTPPLTTVHPDFTEVGHRCVQMVLQQIRNETPPAGTTLVSTTLMVRESTAPLRA